MINKIDNPVEWALLNYQLSDALEYLNKLIEEKMEAEDFDEVSFQIDLAHVYSHLNRAWNMRNHEGDLSDEEFRRFAEFPLDLMPL